MAFLLWAAGGAQAQTLALPAAPAAKAAPEAPVLTRAELRQTLELLNDPQKRAAFTATLETLLKAQAATAPKPAAAVPLAPNSIGAQVLKASSTWLANLSAPLVSLGHVLEGLPGLAASALHVLQDPDLRAHALDAAWPLALILGLAWLVQWGAARLLRRPIRACANAAPEGAAEPAVAARISSADLHQAAMAEQQAGDVSPEELPGAAVEHVLRRRRFAGAVRLLRVVPFVLACSLLDALPLGCFIAIGYAGALFLTDDLRNIVQIAVMASSVCGAANILARMVFAPARPRVRLVQVSDQGAAYAVRWVWRIFAVGTFGYAAGQIGLLLGLPALAQIAMMKALFLVVHVLLIIVVLQCRRAVAHRIRGNQSDTRLPTLMRRRVAAVWHLMAIFYIAGLWVVWAADIRNGYVRIWHIFLATVGVMVAARLVVIMLLGALDRAFHAPAADSADLPVLRLRVHRYLPWLRGIVATLLWSMTALALLEVWGVDTLAWFSGRALGGRLVSAWLTIAIAAAVAVVIWEAANGALDSHLSKLTLKEQAVKAARLRTLLPILRTMLLTCLIAIFVLTALSEVGVNIAPLLAGAGIVGVAVGFGSQKLVQDFITGIFLLLENTMQVGDWVTVAGLSGSVEHLSIRTLRLRAGDGALHVIPFSAVSTLTNSNRGFGNAAIAVSLPISEDVDRACQVLAEIGAAMKKDKKFKGQILGDLQLWGVDHIENGIYTLTGQIPCSDAGRWPVQREFQRLVLQRFKELEIKLAVPTQNITVTAHHAGVAAQGAAPDGAAPAAAKSLPAMRTHHASS